MDEGVIKFRCAWRRGPPPSDAEVEALRACRRALFRAGLIGWDREHDVGYGNLSVRVGGAVVISGTQTGGIPDAGPEHYTRITSFDIDANRLDCEGPVEASSESLTHLALYEARPDCGAVVHVHSRALWDALAGRAPTTPASAAYGTPAMARAIQAAAQAPTGLVVMGGHPEGLVAWGSTPEAAARAVLDRVGDFRGGP